MDILAVLFGPMVLAWVLLAAMPKGVSFLFAFGIVVVVLGVWAVQPLPPSSGPDDWYRGIGRGGAVLGLAGAGAVLPAQVLRWWKDLGGWYYVLALAVSGFVVFNIAVTFGRF